MPGPLDVVLEFRANPVPDEIIAELEDLIFKMKAPAQLEHFGGQYVVGITHKTDTQQLVVAIDPRHQLPDDYPERIRDFVKRELTKRGSAAAVVISAPSRKAR